MRKPTNSTAINFQEELRRRGIQSPVLEFEKTTRSAADAAAAIGCEVGQIVKSLIFCSKSGRGVLVLTSGANRVDEKRIRDLLGEKLGKADADFVRAQTGYSIGGVPPLAHQEPLVSYIDEDLMGYESLWAAAGTPNAVFELTPDELAAATGGKVAEVKQGD